MRSADKILHTVLTAFLVIAAAGCSPDTAKASLPELDEKALSGYLQKSISFKARHSGSEALQRHAGWLKKELSGFSKFEISEDIFNENTPSGAKTFRNIIATSKTASRSDFILIGAHYDTKYLPDVPDFEGANDGGSGVAALLGMISALQCHAEDLPCQVRFVFFDGEECLNDYTADDGLHGSRHLAQKWAESGELKRCRAMILLDMIGDRDLEITIPQNSSPDLTRKALEIARKKGFSGKLRQFRYAVTDDHVPFAGKGVPVINFIDFSYGPHNTWWHTVQDNLGKVSTKSIKLAGDIALTLFFEIAKETENGLIDGF